MSCTQLKISLKNCNIRKTNFENLRQFFCDFFHVTSMERERESKDGESFRRVGGCEMIKLGIQHTHAEICSTTPDEQSKHLNPHRSK